MARSGRDGVAGGGSSTDGDFCGGEGVIKLIYTIYW